MKSVCKLAAAAAVLVLSLQGADARSRKGAEATNLAASHPTTVASGRAIDVGFSPEGSAETLVVKLIGTAKQSIRVSAYAFTSPRVVRALLEAQRSGVDIKVVVDHKENTSADHSGKARAALNLLVEAGITVRTNDRYAIHHDKFIVVDGAHVETGSFNYTDAAARRNSENALVVWDASDLAATYLAHWQSRFDAGQPFTATY